MRAIHRKLFRELGRLRGQTAAIALVIAGGMATWIISFSTLDSLKMTREAFYREGHFAHVFAQAKRAPDSLAARIAEIPGVVDVQTRIAAAARMEVPGFDDPISGRLMSIPDHHPPSLNRLYLRRGRLPEHASGTEIVAGEAFAEAHGLDPGDRITAVINGRRQTLTLVGVALSPEFVYQIQPGGLFPDYERFGVFWMRERPLANGFDMDGAFNDLALRLGAGARPSEVIDRLDGLLAPYGGTGAFERGDQTSHEYLEAEITQLENMGAIVPVIFLGVAAFLLNVVMSRVIQHQREQIAVLKAFGYRNAAVARHYTALVLIMVATGVVPGVALGAWAGRGLSGLYSEFFRFPFLHYHLAPWVIFSGAGVAALAALAATLRAVYRAARIPPAEAMRPESPPAYRPTLVERWLLKRWLDQPTRMILRRLERRPGKSLLAVLGIAMAGGLLVTGSFQEDAISHMVHVQFNQAQREDLTAVFTEPVERRALFELAALPGVMHAEPFRAVPARLRAGSRSYRTAIQGFEPGTDLHRVLDRDLEPVRMPAEGLLLSEYLAGELRVAAGDPVTVEVLEGARPVRRTRVAGTVNEFIGQSGYMHLGALNRMMREGPRISGVFLQIDPARRPAILRELRERPGVAAVTIREAALGGFYDTMAETILIFALVNTLLAGSVAFGVIYNTARVAFSERARELASLRVLGFTRAEVSYILHGELTLLTLAAVPAGLWIGHTFARLIVESLETDLYRVPLVIENSSYAFSAAVVLACALLSGLLLQRRLNRLDMVAVLKTRE